MRPTEIPTLTPTITQTPVLIQDPSILIAWDYTGTGIDENTIIDTHIYVSINQGAADNISAGPVMGKRVLFSGQAGAQYFEAHFQ